MNAEAAYIRDAIGRGEYRMALAQWNDYAKRLRIAVEKGVIPLEQMDEARALVEWSRAALESVRAQLREQLHELEVARAYNILPGRSSTRIETRL